jgi:hypothetical protein
MKTKILIIGSVAFRNHFGSSHREFGRDLDIIGAYDDVIEFIKKHNVKSLYPSNGGKKVIAHLNHKYGLVPGVKYDIIEAEIAWSDSTAKSLLDLHDKYQKVDTAVPFIDAQFASIDELLALKLSHRYLKNNPYFEKTRNDISILRGLTAVKPEYEDWLKAREAETYTYSHPKLNVSKQEFFKDDVPYKYDHDSIHEAVKTLEKPAYTYFLVGEVKTSKDEFFSLPGRIRKLAVYEEACVLALERSIIPFNTDPTKAFKKALEKVCTSITSGWFREYAWENYYEVLNMFNSEFVSNFKKGLENGTVKPFTGKNAY